MNDDLDSMNDLDSILAEFGGSAPQEEAPAVPAAAEEPTPQPVVEPEVQEEKADGNTHRWRSRDLTAAARPVRKPKPAHMPVSAAPSPEAHDNAPRAGISTLLFGLLAALILPWALFDIHPASGTLSNASGSSILSLSDKLDVYVNNAASDALGELAYIKKQYTLAYSATSAPKPDESRFVTYSIDEADKVMDVIEQARTFGLLDGQDVIFDPSVEFYWDSDIRCYCDETILAICWKEKINDRVCSFVEVKLADGSQIRRKLVNDTFGSNEKAVASELSRSANAVIAMNADYYKYRDLGVCVYQGQLCRYETSCDVLFIDANGDFRMLSASELGSREDVEQYIADNNIQFSMSFGPILVRDGELQQLTGSYAGGIGEMYEQYSRSGIGQYDKLHYLIATVNHSQDGTPRATVNQFAEIIYGKGVQNAYNFDGGQTSEVLINNERYNYVDWDNEREVSDILYFATAIPEQEVG